MSKVRRCFWVDDRALLLIQAKGVDVSTLINRVMILFAGLPEDPREALIREQSEEIMIRLRISYENEIRARIKKDAAKHQAQDLERARTDQRLADLMSLGDQLKQLSFFDQLERDLMRGDPDTDLWEDAAVIVSTNNPIKYDLGTLWNTAIDWYRQYGRFDHENNKTKEV